MTDFEKLGLFYLGRTVDPATRTATDVPLLYDASDLVTHAAIVGMTGSGKTGLGIGLIEEAAIDGVPVIAIDPKGDLANLLLTFPQLSAAEFAPWVNPDEARQAGKTVEVFASEESKRWATGLAEWGQDGARIERLRAAAEFAVYTPGSSAGRPLSIVKSFAAPDPEVVNDPELLSDRVTTAVTSVLTLAGVEADPVTSREHVLLSSLFTEAWRAGRNLDLATLIAQVQSPAIAKIGVVDLESFFPAKDRFALAMRLNQLLAAPGFAAWLEGEPLDLDRLFYSGNGRPRVCVMSIAHLDDNERMFFVSLLLNEIVSWMRSQRGTSSLRAMLYFDEIFGYLPPVANPPSKAPLLTLLKQARAFGLGLVVATQNPVDLDYKALANTGTWMLGRLQTERDKARVLDGLEGAATASGATFDRARLDRELAGLSKRTFLLHNVHEAGPALFQTRWTLSYLRGPLGRNEIKALTASVSAPVVAQAPAPSTERTVSIESTSNAPPVLDPAIPQFFLRGDKPSGLSSTHSGSSSASLVPMLLGVARIGYTDSKLGLDETREIVVVTPITDGAVAIDWEHAEPADFKVSDLTKSLDRPATFAPLPSPAAKAKNYALWEKEFGRWAGQTQSIELYRSRALQSVSKPDESERDYRIRLQAEAREARDAAIAKTREKYAPKIAALEERRRKASQAVAVQQEQASGAKVQAAISLGATVFGALLGRKAISASSLGRATTAARGMGKVGRESQDVTRAAENVEAIDAQIAEKQSELESELQAVSQRWDDMNEPFERVLVKPKRGAVSVQLVGLAWL